jgi:hypothetical protein
VIEPLFEKATVKETVAFSRFPSVLGTGRPKIRADCAQECAQGTVPRDAVSRRLKALAQLRLELEATVWTWVAFTA